MEVASYNFFCDKSQKEYKNTEMKICANYIVMYTGTSENKDAIKK